MLVKYPTNSIPATVEINTVSMLERYSDPRPSTVEASCVSMLER